jgi:hypothetical protein
VCVKEGGEGASGCDMWGVVTEVGENEPGFCYFVHQNPPNNPKCQQRANGDKCDAPSAPTAIYSAVAEPKTGIFH